jgi:hypothetical protein
MAGGVNCFRAVVISTFSCSRPDLEKIRGVPSFLQRLLLGICAAIAPITLCAADPVVKSEAAPAVPPAAATNAAQPDTKAAPATDPDVLALPKIQVTAKRVKELDKAIKKLDKAIAREKNNLKASDLDKVLNNPKLADAAVIFGGNSSAYLESVAATRVRYMEAERGLLEDMKEPRSLEDLAILQQELDKVRIMQRELDSAKH